MYFFYQINFILNSLGGCLQEKMRAEQSKFLASVDASVDDDDTEFGQEPEKPNVSDDAEQSETVCSLCHDSSSSVPISFLILLQVCN